MCSECPLLPVKSPQLSPERTYFFLTKFKMTEVIPELFDIYFNVIPHFRMISNAEFISEVISNF